MVWSKSFLFRFFCILLLHRNYSSIWPENPYYFNFIFEPYFLNPSGRNSILEYNFCLIFWAAVCCPTQSEQLLACRWFFVILIENGPGCFGLISGNGPSFVSFPGSTSPVGRSDLLDLTPRNRNLHLDLPESTMLQLLFDLKLPDRIVVIDNYSAFHRCWQSYHAKLNVGPNWLYHAFVILHAEMKKYVMDHLTHLLTMSPREKR